MDSGKPNAIELDTCNGSPGIRAPETLPRAAAPNVEPRLFLPEALAYVARGWSIIPIRHKAGKGKEPACCWKRYQRRAPSRTTLRRWFSRTDLHGLAVVCGDVSNLVVRDFDKAEAYERWAAAYPRLAAILPTVRTARGYHIYFRSTCRGIRHEADGELRGAGYCLLPPSVHPSGATYEWLVPLPEGQLPAVNPFQSGLAILETERTEKTEITEDNRDNRSNEGVVGVVRTLLSVSDKNARDIADAISATQPQSEGERNWRVFDFCRALKAIPALHDAAPARLRPAVKLWHERALPIIGTKSFEDTWADFLYGWPRVRFALGNNPMAMIMDRVTKAPLPKEALDYDAPETRRLVSLCRELQRASGNSPFFLSCRTAGELLGLDHLTAWRRLTVLVADGLIKCVTPGTRSRAARYRYVASR